MMGCTVTRVRPHVVEWGRDEISNGWPMARGNVDATGIQAGVEHAG